MLRGGSDSKSDFILGGGLVEASRSRRPDLGTMSGPSGLSLTTLLPGTFLLPGHCEMNHPPPRTLLLRALPVWGLKEPANRRAGASRTVS